MVDNILPDSNRPGHETLQERVYQQLRFDIMTGKFVPGKAVTIRGLAEKMGTSPMPVREALRRLVAEQALQLLPNRRVTVPDMSVEKYREIAEARVALEPLAARRAFPYITDEIIQNLIATDKAVDDAIAEGNVEKYLVKNMEFHFIIYRTASSSVIMPLIESLWLQISPFLNLAMHSTGLGTVDDQHRAAVKAIREKDVDGLCEAIRLDIMDGVNRMPEAEFKISD